MPRSTLNLFTSFVFNLVQYRNRMKHFSISCILNNSKVAASTDWENLFEVVYCDTFLMHNVVLDFANK